MTRKKLNRKKLTKRLKKRGTKHRKMKRKTLKGGAPMLAKAGADELIEGIKAMLYFGLMSIITAPVYLTSLLFQSPLNTPNNISGKRLENVKSDLVHTPVYKSMFYGNDTTKNLDTENFNLTNKRYTLQGEKIFVECDNCRKEKEATNDLSLGASPLTNSLSKIPGLSKLPIPNLPMKGLSKLPMTGLKGGGMIDSLKKVLGTGDMSNLLGLLDEKEKIQYILNNFFNYFNSLQMIDSDREKIIHKYIHTIKNKDSILKCLIVFKNLFEDEECNTMRDNTSKNADKQTEIDSAIKMIPNPFINPTGEKLDLMKSSKCMVAHLLNDKFEGDTADCSPCPNCTLKSSIKKLAKTYTSSINEIVKGSDRNIDTLSELFYNSFKVYIKGFSVEPITLELTNLSQVKENPDGFFNEIIKKYELKPELKPVFNKDKLKKTFDSDTTKDNFNNFKKLLCKYNINEVLKQRYIELVFDASFVSMKNNPKFLEQWKNEFADNLNKIYN